MEEHKRDGWDTVADFSDWMWHTWYSWGRDWRYQRTLRRFGKLLLKDWEDWYETDPEHTRFTLRYYASDRRHLGMDDTDYSLYFRTHGFKTVENRVKAIHHLERLLYIRFQMHPADAFNKCIVPEVEEHILRQIIGAMPESKAHRYTFHTEALSVYRNDWDSDPDNHWMHQIVAIRQTD